MDSFLVIIAIVALLAVLILAAVAYRNRENKSLLIKLAVGAGAAILALIGAILALGRRKGAEVIEVRPHERTVAPGDGEKALVDAEAKEIEDGASELGDRGAELDADADTLDKKHDRLEEQARETDRDMAESDPGSSPDRRPDPDIVSRLRK